MDDQMTRWQDDQMTEAELNDQMTEWSTDLVTTRLDDHMTGRPMNWWWVDQMTRSLSDSMLQCLDDLFICWLLTSWLDYKITWWPNGWKSRPIDNQMTGWPNDWMTRWLDDQMTGRPDDKMTRWKDDCKTRWPKNRSSGWLGDCKTGWKDDCMTRWPKNRPSEWSDVCTTRLTLFFSSGWTWNTIRPSSLEQTFSFSLWKRRVTRRSPIVTSQLLRNCFAKFSWFLQCIVQSG